MSLQSGVSPKPVVAPTKVVINQLENTSDSLRITEPTSGQLQKQNVGEEQTSTHEKESSQVFRTTHIFIPKILPKEEPIEATGESGQSKQSMQRLILTPINSTQQNNASLVNNNRTTETSNLSLQDNTPIRNVNFQPRIALNDKPTNTGVALQNTSNSSKITHAQTPSSNPTQTPPQKLQDKITESISKNSESITKGINSLNIANKSTNSVVSAQTSGKKDKFNQNPQNNQSKNKHPQQKKQKEKSTNSSKEKSVNKANNVPNKPPKLNLEKTLHTVEVKTSTILPVKKPQIDIEIDSSSSSSSEDSENCSKNIGLSNFSDNFRVGECISLNPNVSFSSIQIGESTTKRKRKIDHVYPSEIDNIDKSVKRPKGIFATQCPFVDAIDGRCEFQSTDVYCPIHQTIVNKMDHVFSRLDIPIVCSKEKEQDSLVGSKLSNSAPAIPHNYSLIPKKEIEHVISLSSKIQQLNKWDNSITEKINSIHSQISKLLQLQNNLQLQNLNIRAEIVRISSNCKDILSAYITSLTEKEEEKGGGGGGGEVVDEPHKNPKISETDNNEKSNKKPKNKSKHNKTNTKNSQKHSSKNQ